MLQDDESEEECDMRMEVIPIPHIEVQLGLLSDPSTMQVRSHVEFVVQVPDINASEMAA